MNAPYPVASPVLSHGVTDNRQRRHALPSVQPRIRAQIYRVVPRYRDLTECVAEHRQLLDAIRSGDPSVLREPLEEHVLGSPRKLLGTTGTAYAAMAEAAGADLPEKAPAAHGDRTAQPGGQSQAVTQ